MMRYKHLRWLTGLMISWTLGLGAASAAGLKLDPIQFKVRDGTVVDAERGSFDVPEDRKNPASRSIPVAFVRFKSTNPHPGSPIVYLAGGPGASGIDAARGPRFKIFMALRAVADVIAFDQRGTGENDKTPECRVEKAPEPALPMTHDNFAAYYADAYRSCWSYWTANKVAIEGYNSIENAADVDQLRKYIGARKLNLWAISYGTHLALTMMKYHPGSVDRVVLASAEGLDQTVKLPARVDAALIRMVSAVGTPELITKMRRVHARLDQHPVTMAYKLPDGSTFKFTLTAFPIQLIAGSLVKNPSDYPKLAQLYEALDAGAYDALAPTIYGAFWKNRLTLHAMPMAMDLASGVSRERLALIEAQRGDALLGDALNFPLPSALTAVAGADLGPKFRRQSGSGHHVLLFSGDLDVRTPVEEQTEALSGFRNLTQVLVKGAGHDVYETHPAIPAMITDFFSGRPVSSAPLVLPDARKTS